MMGDGLFSDFDAVDPSGWKGKITEDLKGKDYERTVVGSSPDGIRVEPFYHLEDRRRLESEYGQDALFSRGVSGSWLIGEEVAVRDTAAANAQALEGLQAGAEYVVFDLQGRPLSAQTARALLHGIHTDMAPVSFTNYLPHGPFDALPPGVLFTDDEWLNALTSGNRDYPEALAGGARGTFTDGVSEAFTVNGHRFRDAGATLVEELAWSLALSQEYLLHGARGRARFRMATGGDHFFEMAGLRALRRLWLALRGDNREVQADIFMECRSAAINKSLLDAHTNMLRNTSECMAAAFGGADAILIRSHDSTAGESSAGSRWARNISLLLRHESHAGRVADPAHGSYYLEQLTNDLCQAAWQKIQDIEEAGGFVEAWESGLIARAIDKSLAGQVDRLANRQSTLVGVNNYPNEADKVPENTGGEKPDEVLAPVHIAAAFERLRRNARLAGAGGKPVYLLGAGKAALRRARMNFSANFLGCAGLVTAESTGEEPFEAELGKLRKGGYRAVVLCCEDSQWEELLPALTRSVGMPVILAGNPGGLPEQLRGLPAHAIYTGCPMLETLEAIQRDVLGLA